MPFVSKAQRRKFYHLKSQGKMTQAKIDEWEKDTPKNLPEKLAFWRGFEKQAWLTTGAGKGVTERAGTSDSFREAFVGDETSASKDATTFWDGERNPRSYKPFDPGTPIFDAEDGSHVRY